MSAPAKKETPCPDCGEMVRVNALRCWNCGAFMNREVEAKFLQMQANPAPMIFSELPAAEIHEYVEETEQTGSDDDFELTVPNPAVYTGEKPQTFTGAAPASKGESSSAPQAEAAPPSDTKSVPDVPHSVATGGDALLDIAMQELAESRSRRQKKGTLTGGLRTPGGGLLIFCPYGCKIEVKEEHRGMQGKCPKCQAPFIVPVDPPRFKKAKATTDAPEAASVSGKFANWLKDMHLHVVSPEKLKLKADSLVKEFVDADFGFSSGNLLIAILQKKAGGLFGGGPKKDDIRSSMYQHLKVDGPLSDTPVAEKYIFTAEEARQMKIVQPSASRSDNMFHGIPVFGAGRIAVQLPSSEKSKDPLFVSMGITEFWELRKLLGQHFGMTDFGAEAGLPKEPVYKDYFCHYTATKIKALENVDLFKADPKAELVTAGFRCGACGLVVSEAGRAKENLGGKGGKGIAKAKCPKCSNKMGENPLYSLKAQVEEPSMSGAPASGEKAST